MQPPIHFQLKLLQTAMVVMILVLPFLQQKALAQLKTIDQSIAQSVEPDSRSVFEAAETNVVILGQPCNQPYVIAIPAREPGLLEQVQSHVPSAFLTYAPNGLYVQAGSASEQSTLTALTQRLRDLGFDARVAFRPVRCTAR